MNTSRKRGFHKVHCTGILLFGASLLLGFFLFEPANWGSWNLPFPGRRFAVNWQLTIGSFSILIGYLGLNQAPSVVPDPLRAHWFLKGLTTACAGLLWLASNIYHWSTDTPPSGEFLERANNGPGDLVFMTLLSVSITTWGLGLMMSPDY